MNSYLDLLKAKAELTLEGQQQIIDLVLLNNITLNPIKDYLEYNCSLNNIDVNVRFGDYDNIVQNVQEWDVQGKAIVVFWELANCIHGLEYKIDSYTPEQIGDVEQKIQNELKLCFNSLSKASLVIMNRFTALPFIFLQTESSNLEALANRLNQFCEQEAPSFIKWVNIDKCIGQSGIYNTIDYKAYLKNKVLYKHDFYWNYVQLIQPYFNALIGQVKKLLALDCDNTLWKGILGEDGPEGIAMDGNNYKGQPFAAAQYRALALGKKGVLLALASKNNEEDVDSVLVNHKDMVISDSKLVAKKVNWEAKSENLKQLAKELNIGVDSFVFVDDSDFEVQLMRDQLPLVKTIQVSKNAVDYYVDQQKWFNCFVQLNESAEDKKKLEQYKQNVKRATEEQKHQSFEGFLEALDLELTIHQNDNELIPRMAQMTQKTNQFNLTTPRHTETQISEFVDSPDYDCFAFGVKDKFGDSGISGLSIVRYMDENNASIDALLMSCRILGRKIEFKFLEEILTVIFEKSEIVEARYLPTKKNAQVANFYENIGFKIKEESEGISRYSLRKDTFTPSNSYSYISLNYA